MPHMFRHYVPVRLLLRVSADAVVAFGSRAVQLSPFSASTAEADDALRTLTVDKANGTALYDALQLSANALDAQDGRSRVVVLLTDGKDVSSKVSLANALATAHSAATLVYPIAIGGNSATTAPTSTTVSSGS